MNLNDNLKIKIDYKNKDLEIINTKEFDFIEYCELMSRKILGTLYKIDNYFQGDINHKELRKYIFDIAGNVKRIPDNIKGE